MPRTLFHAGEKNMGKVVFKSNGYLSFTLALNSC